VEQVACPFDSVPESEVVTKNSLWYARWDRFPVTKGHLLVIPYRHVAGYFDTTREEKISLLEIIDDCKKILDEKYSPDGYNIGINIGRVAGQTVMHLHVHVIPRYAGDTERPGGGVRRVIPGKYR
jgi:diadenosine tetraphosphate (Ap4A) HIT family hydrolase